MSDLLPPAVQAPLAVVPPAAPALDPARIIETVRALGDRIGERFPGSGLARVARQLLGIAETTVGRVAAAHRPILGVRVGTGAVILLLAAMLAGLAARLIGSREGIGAATMLQLTEAATNELILLGGATIFLLSAETRLKRRKALAALREMRALAHIIDMHQLTKDPDRWIREPGTDTPSSPQRTMTRHELARYLDYCSELLALNAKLAALYAQNFDDAVVLGAVVEVETLTTGLSGKIWQKLVILNNAGV